jgi:predicted DNA-binding protein (MmcQ/YjbR family)
MNAREIDRALDRIRALCLALPETSEVEAWGHPTFRAGKKMFAAFGQQDGTVTVGLKVGFDRQEELLADDCFFPTPYAAHQGWVSLRLDERTDWDALPGLVCEAYHQVALRRMLKALEAEQGSVAPASRKAPFRQDQSRR